MPKKNLLNKTLAELNLIYPDEKRPETLNEVKRLINKASVEGKLKGELFSEIWSNANMLLL